MRRSNEIAESYLTDNEREVVWIINYYDHKHQLQQAAVHKRHYVDAVEEIYKFCGHVVIESFERMTKSEIKESIG